MDNNIEETNDGVKKTNNVFEQDGISVSPNLTLTEHSRDLVKKLLDNHESSVIIVQSTNFSYNEGWAKNLSITVEGRKYAAINAGGKMPKFQIDQDTWVENKGSDVVRRNSDGLLEVVTPEQSLRKLSEKRSELRNLTRALGGWHDAVDTLEHDLKGMSEDHPQYQDIKDDYDAHVAKTSELEEKHKRISKSIDAEISLFEMTTPYEEIGGSIQRGNREEAQKSESKSVTLATDGSETSREVVDSVSISIDGENYAARILSPVMKIGSRKVAAIEFTDSQGQTLRTAYYQSTGRNSGEKGRFFPIYGAMEKPRPDQLISEIKPGWLAKRGTFNEGSSRHGELPTEFSHAVERLFEGRGVDMAIDGPDGASRARELNTMLEKYGVETIESMDRAGAIIWKGVGKRHGLKPGFDGFGSRLINPETMRVIG